MIFGLRIFFPLLKTSKIMRKVGIFSEKCANHEKKQSRVYHKANITKQKKTNCMNQNGDSQVDLLSVRERNNEKKKRRQ